MTLTIGNYAAQESTGLSPKELGIRNDVLFGRANPIRFFINFQDYYPNGAANGRTYSIPNEDFGPLQYVDQVVAEFPSIDTTLLLTSSIAIGLIILTRTRGTNGRHARISESNVAANCH